jgi:uncharacterized protein YqjF (DUF2071 family)
MRQRWHDLLFAHWPVEPETMRAALPAPLRPHLDLYDGRAWAGVIPFWMSGVRFRGTPAIPGLSRFPELNVRTYVSVGGVSGVHFFSLDATCLPAVWGARTAYHLPYQYAEMSVVRSFGVIGDTPAESVPVESGEIGYLSNRLDAPAAEFRARYRGWKEPAAARPGSLEHFLMERYCLYSVSPGGEVYRAHIHHAPWRLQAGQAEFDRNTMTAPLGIELAGKPVLHYADEIEVLVWWPERVR